MTCMLGTISIHITNFGRKISTTFQVMEQGHKNVYFDMQFFQQNSAIVAFVNENNHLLSLVIGMSVLADSWHHTWKVLSLMFCRLRFLASHKVIVFPVNAAKLGDSRPPCCCIGTPQHDPGKGSQLSTF